MTRPLDGDVRMALRPWVWTVIMVASFLYVVLLHVAAIDGVLHHFQLWGRQ